MTSDILTPNNDRSLNSNLDAQKRPDDDDDGAALSFSLPDRPVCSSGSWYDICYFCIVYVFNSTQNVSIVARRASKISITTSHNNISSVDYIARCGLGHHLARMANATLVAKELNFTLRGWWGTCADSNGNKQEGSLSALV
jgi:hypothetical protein